MLSALSTLTTVAALICAHLHFTHANIYSVAYAGKNAESGLVNKEADDIFPIPAGECKAHFGKDKVGCYYEHNGEYLNLHQLKVEVRDKQQVHIKISEPDINEVSIERHNCEGPVEVKLFKRCLLGGGMETFV